MDNNCQIICDEGESCRGATITCPANYFCNIQCTNYRSCESINIKPPISESNFLLMWGGIENGQCEEPLAFVTYPIYPVNDTKNFTLSCDSYAKCAWMHIICPKYAHCLISCTAQHACNDMTIEWPNITGYGEIICAAKDACFGMDFPVPDPYKPYAVDCAFSRACDEATIYCPKYAYCNVSCVGMGACQKATIEWPQIVGYGTLTCDGYGACAWSNFPAFVPDKAKIFNCLSDATCWNMDITCPTDANCDINCPAYRSCAGAQTITCPINGDCNIACTSRDACESKTIICPTNGICNITCSNIQNPGACRDTTIYCPNNNCHISCSNYGSVCYNMNIFESLLAPEPMPNVTCNPPDRCQYIIYNTFVPPTNQPSSAPTLIPTESTIDPTFFPTKSPSFNPTSAPTTEPTIDPSRNPTTEPTKQQFFTYEPTFDPTSAPTKEPTVDPSQAPTAPPTVSPTLSPSFSPTQNPTRYPISEREYDSFFLIKYLIKDLENEYIEMLLKYIWEVSGYITEMIEQSYMESTGLRFYYFSLEIEDILGYEINDIDEKKYPHFLNSKHEICLAYKIKCDTENCRTLLNSETEQEFLSIAQIKLRQYFPVHWTTLNVNAVDEADDLSQLIFEIDKYGKLEALYPAPQTMFEMLSENKVLVVLCAIMVVMFILSCFSFCHLKGLCGCFGIAMDDSLWNALMIYGLQLIVFVSDINLCFELFSHQEFGSDPTIKICAVSCIVFIIIPYVTNLFCASKITSMIASNTNAISFFEERKVFFMFLIVICGGCYPVLYLLSSGIFGLEIFCSGLTNYELKKMNKIKILATVCLNNIPQICIQCSYAASIHTMTPNTAFAFIVAILSIICTPFRIRKVDGNIRPISYYIEIKIMSENDENTDADKKKFLLNKGKINKMSKILYEALGCDENDIEISRNSNVFFSVNFSTRQQTTLGGSGVSLYVMHFVNKNEMNVEQIVRLYQARDQFLKYEFKKHFGLNGACMIKFKSANGMLKILIDESEVKETNFDKLLKKIMYEKGLDYNLMSDRQKVLNYLYDNNKGTTNGESHGEVKEKQIYTQTSTIELQPLTNNNQTEEEIFDGIVLNQQQEEMIYHVFDETLP